MLFRSFVVDGKIHDKKIHDIDPNSIESITILKDQSAETLYGEKAKNGVILITTKKGESPPTQFFLNGEKINRMTWEKFGGNKFSGFDHDGKRIKTNSTFLTYEEAKERYALKKNQKVLEITTDTILSGNGILSNNTIDQNSIETITIDSSRPHAEDSEKYIFISGKVVSAEDNSPIPDATIIATGISDPSHRGTLTDRNGEFSLKVDTRSKKLVCVAIGKNWKEYYCKDLSGDKMTIQLSKAKRKDLEKVKGIYEKFYDYISSNNGASQRIKISGKVTDKTGEPINGASVIIKGKTIGTITDKNGDYQINVSPEDQSLVFIGPGIEKKEVHIGNQSEINVKLEVQANINNKEPIETIYSIDGEEAESIDHLSIDYIKNVNIYYGDRKKGGTKKIICVYTLCRPKIG